jgi:hypothetical protein
VFVASNSAYLTVAVSIAFFVFKLRVKLPLAPPQLAPMVRTTQVLLGSISGVWRNLTEPVCRRFRDPFTRNVVTNFGRRENDDSLN